MPNVVYRRAIATESHVIFSIQKHALFFVKNLSCIGAGFQSMLVSILACFQEYLRWDLCLFHGPPSSGYSAQEPGECKDSFSAFLAKL